MIPVKNRTAAPSRSGGFCFFGDGEKILRMAEKAAEPIDNRHILGYSKGENTTGIQLERRQEKQRGSADRLN